MATSVIRNSDDSIRVSFWNKSGSGIVYIEIKRLQKFKYQKCPLANFELSPCGCP